jgi:hypothetical protein
MDKIKINIKRDKNRPNLPQTKMNDGFTMSLQASPYAYSTPRAFCDEYEAMEVGFPNREETLLIPYAEEKDKPTDTVYPYVPAEVILAVIIKHGGIKGNILEYKNDE